MEWYGKLILGTEGLFFIAAIIITIFVIFRRIKIKKQETFEDRDN